VMVSVVKRESVTVEFVELSFKDQFISRSDMWRLKQHLVNSCVYLNKTITFAGMRVSVAHTYSDPLPPSLTTSLSLSRVTGGGERSADERAIATLGLHR
jgi:hypothetical protein